MKINGIPKKIKWERSQDKKFSQGHISPAGWQFIINFYDEKFRIQSVNNFPNRYNLEGRRFDTLEDAEKYCQIEVENYWISITELEFNNENTLSHEEHH